MEKTCLCPLSGFLLKKFLFENSALQVSEDLQLIDLFKSANPSCFVPMSIWQNGTERRSNALEVTLESVD